MQPPLPAAERAAGDRPGTTVPPLAEAAGGQEERGAGRRDSAVSRRPTWRTARRSRSGPPPLEPARDPERESLSLTVRSAAFRGGHRPAPATIAADARRLRHELLGEPRPGRAPRSRHARPPRSRAGYAQAMSQFAKLGRVAGREESGTDVSHQYVDLEARARHLEAVERQLLGFLDKTKTIARRARRPGSAEPGAAPARGGARAAPLPRRPDLVRHDLARRSPSAVFPSRRPGTAAAGASPTPGTRPPAGSRRVDRRRARRARDRRADPRRARARVLRRPRVPAPSQARPAGRPPRRRPPDTGRRGEAPASPLPASGRRRPALREPGDKSDPDPDRREDDVEDEEADREDAASTAATSRTGCAASARRGRCWDGAASGASSVTTPAVCGAAARPARRAVARPGG